MSLTTVLVVGFFVWLGTLLALVLLLLSPRVRPTPAPDRRDPVAEPRTRSDIGAGRLVRLIFRSHAVFPRQRAGQLPGAAEWIGSAAELRAALTGPGSLLIEAEKAELPAPEAIARRLVAMEQGESAHYLQVDIPDPTALRPIESIVFRLSLNPEIDTR
jgi:hypothetical protein